MKLKDSLWVGIPMGLLVPSLGILIFYLINFDHTSFVEFLHLAIFQKILSPLLSLCGGIL